MRSIPTCVRQFGAALMFSAVALFVTAGQPAGDPPAGDGDLKWKSFSEAIRDAKHSGRLVLIDVYTNWCGWCKKMDRDVYADTAVIRALAGSFELVKLNAESATMHEIDGKDYSEKSIAQGYGVTGYPTTIFLTSSGEAITTVPGYIPRSTFLDILSYIGTGAYKATGWKDFQQNKGKR
jgi:thioredoxin-related protein